MTIQTIPKSRRYPIVNITAARRTIEPVIRDSTETLGCNFGKITSPAIIAPVPNDPNKELKTCGIKP